MYMYEVCVGRTHQFQDTEFPWAGDGNWVGNREKSEKN